MKRLTVGIFAHVDAGKTTCIEGFLYLSGIIQKLGRVDHKDTVLDFDEEERKHGITIYSKEALFNWKDTEISVIDTPGHLDFVSEVERCLRVIDVAVLLINGQDGIQSHTETIWKELEKNHIPTIVFINKMDISYKTKEELLLDFKNHSFHHLVCFNEDDTEEMIALQNDSLLDVYTKENHIPSNMIQEAILKREVIPYLFGSCLKMEGVEELLDLLNDVSIEKEYPTTFKAKAYKISYDEENNRLTHIKIFGGVLHVKDKIEEEKVDQIRIYTGEKYRTVNQAETGMVCALKGLKNTTSYSDYGYEDNKERSGSIPVLRYSILIPENADKRKLIEVCKDFMKEDPSLDISIDQNTNEIGISLMGEIQKEVLQNKMMERTNIPVTFDEGKVILKETILDEGYGIGHFEPLRHYAEVVVKLRPLPTGSGIIIKNECSNDQLSLAYQKTILNQLNDINHKGVLVGAQLTDVEIALIDGKGHVKHTEGGDFREASLRAVRQGLMKLSSILLEPYFAFECILDSSFVSKALYDFEQKKVEVSVENLEDGKVCITGKGPSRYLMNYGRDILSYTKGTGKYSYHSIGYYPAIDEEELLEGNVYRPENDVVNPVDSVFCTHGSATIVPWHEVEEYMHINLKDYSSRTSVTQPQKTKVDEDELKRVFDMTFGRNRKEEKQKGKKEKKELPEKVIIEKQLPQCLLVDGYNMIFVWDELKEIANDNIEMARNRLIEMLHHYQSYTGNRLIVVFDGYKVKHQPDKEHKEGNFIIVFTRTNETADIYIEKKVHELKNQYRLMVATSDALIQNAIFSQGAMRMSARELENQIKLLYKLFL